MKRKGNAKYSTRKRIDEPGSLASEGRVVHCVGKTYLAVHVLIYHDQLRRFKKNP
jgi:hypothetical protein